MKRKRALLISCSVILLCMSIIVGMTYALFTDSISVKNHLQAGNLEITLKRNSLKYCILNDEGVLAENEAGELDLTDPTDKNVFELDREDVVIVPGSYFDAEMEIANKGNVAFTYSVTIKLQDNSDRNLAEQLQVTVTRPGETEAITKKLSEFAGGLEISMGSVNVGQAPENFNVKVEFIDDVDDTSIDNNSAQDNSVEFDLIVKATQATE